MAGIIYIVSTPIGNYDDITLRALNVLKGVDEVICEEFKEGRRLLKKYEIEKPLRRMSEHNEKRDTPQIIKELKEGKNFALITDCGTPVFMDTPYRLLTLLKDVMDVLGRETYVILCMDLTTDTEEILRGRIDEVLKRVKEGEKKREFVLIIKPKE